MSPWVVMLRIALAVLFVAALGSLLGIGLRAWNDRREARRTTERFAAQFGLRRLRGETNEELRERCYQAIRIPIGPSSKGGVESLVRAVLWERGHPRAEVKVEAASPGHIRARVSSKASVRELLLVEQEVADQLPCGVYLELVRSEVER